MAPQITIEQFASDLILDVLDFIPKDLPIGAKTLPISKYMSSVVPAVEYFTDEFFNEFEAVFKEYYIQIRDSEADFKQFVISCCSKLSGDGSYLHFLLVCAFILELLHYSSNKRQCFRFTDTGSVCLVHIFNKQFKESFFKLGEWHGLKSFCDSVTKLKEEKDCLSILTGDLECKENIFHLIAECGNKSDSYLTKSECTEQLVLSKNTSESENTSEITPQITDLSLNIVPERKTNLAMPISKFNAPHPSTTDFPEFADASCSSSSHTESENLSVTLKTMAQQSQQLTMSERKKKLTLPLLPLDVYNPSTTEDRASIDASSTSQVMLISKNQTVDRRRRKCLWCGCECYDYVKMCQERYKRKKNFELLEETNK